MTETGCVQSVFINEFQIMTALVYNRSIKHLNAIFHLCLIKELVSLYTEEIYVNGCVFVFSGLHCDAVRSSV